MKNLISLSRLFLALSVIFFATSCDSDLNAPVSIPPSSFLESGADLISESTTIDPGTIINVRLSANAGDNEMNSVTIRENGDLLPIERIDVNGVPLDNNPSLLFDSDRSSFVYDLAITPHESGTATYEFITAGMDPSDNDVTSIDITITDGVFTFGITGATSISLTDPSLVTVNLVATQGVTPLNTIAVLEDGVVMSELDRLRYGSASNTFDGNPFIIPAEDKAGFGKQLFINAPSAPGEYDYTIILEDEAGDVMQANYMITIIAQPTPISEVFSGIPLFNNAGANFGTIDLDTGTNLSSINNSNSDIKDIGNEGGVWAQRIEPINGAVLRIISPDYTFNLIDSRETMVAAWDASGVDLQASGTIDVGSTYMARVGAADYYVFTCVTVNAAGSANDQQYSFDIKKSAL